MVFVFPPSDVLENWDKLAARQDGDAIRRLIGTIGVSSPLSSLRKAFVSVRDAEEESVRESAAICQRRREGRNAGVGAATLDIPWLNTKLSSDLSLRRVHWAVAGLRCSVLIWRNTRERDAFLRRANEYLRMNGVRERVGEKELHSRNRLINPDTLGTLLPVLTTYSCGASTDLSTPIEMRYISERFILSTRPRCRNDRVEPDPSYRQKRQGNTPA